MAYASKGGHPYSDYKGKVLHNLSGMDLIVDIDGMYFPCVGSVVSQREFKFSRRLPM